MGGGGGGGRTGEGASHTIICLFTVKDLIRSNRDGIMRLSLHVHSLHRILVVYLFRSL